MTHTKPLFFALLSGTLFGLGMAMSQMMDPAKVVNFLDITGTWDPSLAFVMIGGLIVNIIATPLILKRERPIFTEIFRVPAKTEIDPKIIIGGLLFGAGWGLAGYCPGPMLTSISFANVDIMLVISAYVVGTFITKWATARYEAYKHVKHAENEACVG